MQIARETALEWCPVDSGSLIDGHVSERGGDQIELLDPDRMEAVGRISETSAEQVDRAVVSAAKAFAKGEWAHAEPQHRAAVLRRAASLVRERAEHLAALDSLTAGLLYHRSTFRHAQGAADWFDFFAQLIEEETPEVFRASATARTFVTREPVGVVGLFTPWNVPLPGAALKLAASLGMGNCAVIKPSELTPHGTWELVRILHEAGVPKDVLHLVNGRGQVTGAALAAHPDVAAVSFTGGPVAGSAIASVAAARFAKITMELGGKSANIVFADADYDAALAGSVAAIFSNSGQACLAGSRLLLQRPLADRFITDLVARTRALRIGHSFDPAADIGAQSSPAQMERVLGFVASARAQGAQILTGGGRAPGFGGCQVEPTIALVADNTLEVCQTEVFGPLLTVQLFDEAEEAIAIANDTRLGLAGYVWSSDADKTAHVAGALRTGSVMINSTMIREKRAPFGGFGQSGVDREGGRWSLDFYSEAKATVTANQN